MTSAHFTDKELACPCCGVNYCVDKLVNALEALRTAIGLPIQIDSGYRCASHNKAVGGEANSQHVLGMAADIRVTGLKPADIYREARKIPAFGGFGVAANFVHVDVRTTVAKWTYGPDHKQRPWTPELDKVAV